MKRGLFLLTLILMNPLWAGCPGGDRIAQTQGMRAALPVYMRCALDHNDDQSQLKLARLYRKGSDDIDQSTQRSLLFYHLSADNGNAAAMVEFSTLLTQLDNDDSGREEILSYSGKIKKQLLGSPYATFQGDFLHPYALLVLAAESTDDKWFYPSETKTDTRAKSLIVNYRIDDDKKEQILREASEWKQRKLLELARHLLSPREFNQFYTTLYPPLGQADPFQRSQAVNHLKQKLESRSL